MSRVCSHPGGEAIARAAAPPTGGPAPGRGPRARPGARRPGTGKGGDRGIHVNTPPLGATLTPRRTAAIEGRASVRAFAMHDVLGDLPYPFRRGVAPKRGPCLVARRPRRGPRTGRRQPRRLFRREMPLAMPPGGASRQPRSRAPPILESDPPVRVGDVVPPGVTADMARGQAGRLARCGADDRHMAQVDAASASRGRGRRAQRRQPLEGPVLQGEQALVLGGANDGPAGRAPVGLGAGTARPLERRSDRVDQKGGPCSIASARRSPRLAPNGSGKERWQTIGRGPRGDRPGAPSPHPRRRRRTAARRKARGHGKPAGAPDAR